MRRRQKRVDRSERKSRIFSPVAPQAPRTARSRTECSVERSRGLPQSLTFRAQMPRFRQKYRSAPANSHLQCAFSPVLAHLWRLPHQNRPKSRGHRPSRKRSPSGLPRSRADFQVLPAIHSHELLQNLTFGQTVWWRGVLNPLTLRPAAAHRDPRTSSLQRPARAHHLSRKASPSRPETPAT